MSTASAYLTVGGIDVDVVYKDIKNLHIGVYPPMGRVRVAAPERLDDDQVRLAVVQRLPWIKRQREQLQAAERQSATRDGHRRVALRLGESPPAQGHRAPGPSPHRDRWRSAAALRACGTSAERPSRTARPLVPRTATAAIPGAHREVGAEDRASRCRSGASAA